MASQTLVSSGWGGGICAALGGARNSRPSDAARAAVQLGDAPTTPLPPAPRSTCAWLANHDCRRRDCSRLGSLLCTHAGPAPCRRRCRGDAPAIAACIAAPSAPPPATNVPVPHRERSPSYRFTLSRCLAGSTASRPTKSGVRPPARTPPRRPPLSHKRQPQQPPPPLHSSLPQRVRLLLPAQLHPLGTRLPVGLLGGQAVAKQLRVPAPTNRRSTPHNSWDALQRCPVHMPPPLAAASPPPRAAGDAGPSRTLPPPRPPLPGNAQAPPAALPLGPAAPGGRGGGGGGMDP